MQSHALQSPAQSALTLKDFYRALRQIYGSITPTKTITSTPVERGDGVTLPGAVKKGQQVLLGLSFHIRMRQM